MTSTAATVGDRTPRVTLRARLAMDAADKDGSNLPLSDCEVPDEPTARALVLPSACASASKTWRMLSRSEGLSAQSSWATALTLGSANTSRSR